MSNRATIGPKERKQNIKALQVMTDLDVLIIGGGVTGAGIALDAVTRGLSTGLVEATDFAFGTSSRSSKLIHGGIRYLEQLNFTLVKEALKERGLLMNRIAPHLVQPIKFVYPLRKAIVERLYVGTGMWLYDTMSRIGAKTPSLPRHQHINKSKLLREIPDIKQHEFHGGLSYSDGLVDDARFVTGLIRTAASYGAKIVNRTKVKNFIVDNNRVKGVVVEDTLTGQKYPIKAKQIINATGVWLPQLQKLLPKSPQMKVRVSKGIHLVIPKNKFRSKHGLLLPTEKSVLFIIPWKRNWLIGTTDTDWSGDLADPTVTPDDINYLLSRVNTILKKPLTKKDVQAVYAGLRPLIAGEQKETAKLSREHQVKQALPGLTMITGGKFTTYRIMAKDAVDAVAKTFNFKVPESITENISLIGAEGVGVVWNNRNKLAKRYNLKKLHIEHLIRRYGYNMMEVLQLIEAEPDLGRQISKTTYLVAEVVYAIKYEGALQLDDVLSRRMRLNIEAQHDNNKEITEIANIMATVLDWTPKETSNQINHYLQKTVKL